MTTKRDMTLERQAFAADDRFQDARDATFAELREQAQMADPVLKAETLDPVPAPPACVELDAIAAAWHQAYVQATAKIAEYTEIRDRAAGQIQAAMGDAPEARIAGRKVITWAWSKPRMILSREALEADLGPEKVAGYLRASKPSRPFKMISGA